MEFSISINDVFIRPHSKVKNALVMFVKITLSGKGLNAAGVKFSLATRLENVSEQWDAKCIFQVQKTLDSFQSLKQFSDWINQGSIWSIVDCDE